ncbi:MAG: DUF1015 domain-containing protein [Thermodesulfobacteriota bacterium]
MANIRPFQAIRFNKEKIGRMENVVSPPYDVIDEKDMKDMIKKSPYNIVQLDLTKHMGEESPEERYGRSRKFFQQWQKEGVLIQDEKPGIYLYYTHYNLPSGRRLTRKGMMVEVRLAEFSEGVIKRHEKTFSNAVDDRLDLLDTCRSQFSPIFSLFSDQDNSIINTLEQYRSAAPLYSVKDHDGCTHYIWPITDTEAITRVQEMLIDKCLYIADGHHRYTTALQFRELMKKRLGEIKPDSPYNHTMMYICPMEEEGLSVLPTHRLLDYPGILTAEGLVELMRPYFEVEEIKGGGREILTTEALSRMETNRGRKTMFGMYEPDSDRCFLLTLKRGVMAEVIGDHLPKALQELDVVVLSKLIIEHILGLNQEQCDREGFITYRSDSEDALDDAIKKSSVSIGTTPVLFLMNSTPVPQLKKISDEDLTMPQKSTYFYPKILTGLLVRKVD